VVYHHCSLFYCCPSTFWKPNFRMSTLINSLKSEIARVARKELKEELQALRKVTTVHRSEIAALKRQIKSLATALRAAAKPPKSASKKSLAADAVAGAPGIRFSPKRLTELREKFGITQSQMATLLGVSYLSVHKWEAGSAHPRAAQLGKIATASKLGKREVLRKLQD
jgi:DNA-binding transcriptional regulator YiaG